MRRVYPTPTFQAVKDFAHIIDVHAETTRYRFGMTGGSAQCRQDDRFQARRAQNCPGVRRLGRRFNTRSFFLWRVRFLVGGTSCTGCTLRYQRRPSSCILPEHRRCIVRHAVIKRQKRPHFAIAQGFGPRWRIATTQLFHPPDFSSGKDRLNCWASCHQADGGR